MIVPSSELIGVGLRHWLIKALREEFMASGFFWDDGQLERKHC